MVLMTVNKVVIKNKADIHPEDTVKYMVTNNYVHERKSLYTNHKANIIKKGKEITSTKIQVKK